jgi:hypothetical protein
MEINIRPITIDINVGGAKKFDTAYITPRKIYEIDEQYLKYQLAEDLANDLPIEKDCRHFVIIDGKFIFGDYIEALVVKNNWIIKSMTISTLSLSAANVDSLVNLVEGGYLEKLDLIVSDYFFSHERQGLVPYIYHHLNKNDMFQLAVAGSHCKMCIFETECGKFVCIHGSANLRSSSNIEQIVVEESKALYDFNFEYQQRIVDYYKTIKKSLRYRKLWDQVAKSTQE